MAATNSSALMSTMDSAMPSTPSRQATPSAGIHGTSTIAWKLGAPLPVSKPIQTALKASSGTIETPVANHRAFSAVTPGHSTSASAPSKGTRTTSVSMSEPPQCKNEQDNKADRDQRIIM